MRHIPVILIAILTLVALTMGVVPCDAAAADAAADAHVCHKCGESISGGYFETAGHFYHPDHFRCAHCDLRIDGAYTEHKGNNYHNECFRDNVALRCDLCGGVIQGEYVIDYWGNAYHLRHTKEAPMCDSCSRFISPDLTGGGVRYDDGRYICGLCRDKSVKSIEEILELVNEVAAHMSSLGMEVEYKGMKVHLVGRDQMQNLAGEHSSGLRGFTDYEEDWRIFGHVRGRKLNVYFLYAMPRMELISTIAHELGHIYMFNHGRFGNDRAWSEGSCNYAAWRVLGKYPGRDSSFFRANMMQDDDPVYGAGFRRVKRYAEAEGTDAWIKRLRKKSDLPKGY
ncbi:MAG: hypothetical protein IH969_03225 [Candidatus Krumholzibacteriota bacterium]|nr:hypothetical protein [Candidatus Krumholzibacteriota bacterium]